VVRAGNCIENPITGETMRFILTGHETEGECLRIDMRVRPGGFVAAEHVHPQQEERFLITSGQITLRMDGRERVYTAGENITIPRGTPLFIVADHGHTLIHREFYPNARLRERGLLRFGVEKPKGLADVDPATKAFVLDPGRVYLHRAGRFPLGTVGAAEADELVARLREEFLALHDETPGAPAGGRPVPRVWARDELYRGPHVERAPDLVLHFANGYDPKGALARTEVFGRSALTGMHTYDDSLFFVNRAGVPTDDLDIVDLAPSILTLLGVPPPADMDGRVRLSA